jgi:hypothetical protein
MSHEEVLGHRLASNFRPVPVYNSWVEKEVVLSYLRTLGNGMGLARLKLPSFWLWVAM